MTSQLDHMPMKLIAGQAHPALAAALAAETQLPLIMAEVSTFADGESRVEVDADVRGTSLFLIQPTCPPVNDHLMALVLLADAVRAAGAARVTAVVPYFGYARQEQRERPGQPRSAQVVSRLLGSVGIDHLITLDLHVPALESALPMPVTLLHGESVFLPCISTWKVEGWVVVSPDAGGIKRAQRYAAALQSPLAVIAKQRGRPDQASVVGVLGDVQGRPCLVVDDMASTGGTLAGAADALRRAGATQVCGAFTHAVMAPQAEARLAAAGFERLITTDSIPVTSKPWLQIVPVASLLATAVRGLAGDASPPSKDEDALTKLKTVPRGE